MRAVKGTIVVIAAGLLAVACESPPPPKPVSGGLYPDAAYRPVNIPPDIELTEEQVKMDLLVKVHSELMVTGLSCPKYYNDPTMFRAYGAFTVNNQDRVLDVQSDLGKFLGKHLSGSAPRLFDTYRTKMANDESQSMIRQTQAVYCQMHKEQYYTITNFTPQQLDDYINRSYAVYGERYNQVGKPATVAAAPESPVPPAPAAAATPPAAASAPVSPPAAAAVRPRVVQQMSPVGT
jgi:hypothetical protein